MNNLFVLHTQYNIILGSAIILEQGTGCRNDLVVYAEFTLSESYQKRIESVFDNVLYIRKRFQPWPENNLEQEWELFREWAVFRMSKLAKVNYDNVFLSQDRQLDSMIFGYCKNRNVNCRCSDIEEDCYYSLKEELNRDDVAFSKKIGFSEKFRRFFYGSKYLYESPRSYYGQSSFFDTHYVLYPDCVRSHILKRKTVVKPIDIQALVKAVRAVYGDDKVNIPQSSKYYIFFFDLMNRYSNPDGIKSIVSNLAGIARKENAVLLVKYHPRETARFELENFFEVPGIIPAEKLLCDLYGKDVCVFGNATTSIIVANKMGFRTTSISRLNGSDNEAMHSVFRKMGIFVPEQMNELIYD